MMKEAIASTANALRKEISGDYGERGVPDRTDEASFARIVDSWPETPQKVARRMAEKYGRPNEALQSRLIWYANGPWKRTIVYRDEVPHNFPKPHTDLLEQFIDYKVPVEKFSELAAYDGSVIPERTKGEMSARCDMEEMNFLALNLAHDIVTGQRSVEESRDMYARTATDFMSGNPSDYTTGLLFAAPGGPTADFDSPSMCPVVDELMQKAREAIGVGGQ